MSNRMRQAYVNAYRSAQQAAARNEIRRERIRVTDEIDELTEQLSDLQKDVTDERGTWNTYASGAGCLIGGFLGSGGGPAGMMSGCSLGSQIVSTGADYAYDSTLLTTDLEAQLQAAEQELKEYDIELSDLSKMFPEYGGVEFEERMKTSLDTNLKLYDEWEEGFYGKEGQDYAMDLVGIVAQYGATKVGGAILNDAWVSAFPESDFAIEVAKSKDITTGSGISEFTYQLPDFDAEYGANLWQQYVVDNKIYSGNY